MMGHRKGGYGDLGDALRIAYDHAPCGVYYSMGHGWIVYDLTEGCPDGIPDFMIVRPGSLPVVLNEDAEASLISLIRSKLK